MERFKQTKKVVVLGIISNIFLLALKLVTGFASQSQAMIADAFNSAGDVFASIMTYTGNKIASIPEDKNHPYGHGKAEYIFSMLISFSLVIVAYKILTNSLNALLAGKSFIFSIWLIIIALITIVIKSVLFLYTRKVGLRNENLLVLANSEDHRNDILVSSSTLSGIVLGALGINWVDGLVGIGISLWIAITGLRIFLRAYHVLMDTNIDEVLKDDVVKTIESVKGVDHVDSVTAKPIGVGFIIIIKVSVFGKMTVQEGHSVAARIKERVKICKNVKDVVVHVNPA